MAKTETELRLNSSDYNAATAKTQGNHEIWNSAANWQKINELYKSGQAYDMKDEPKHGGQPVIITGSGPSLDDSISKLKDWTGGIICHYSQAVSLAYMGVEPDYIMALDALCNWEGLCDIDWSKLKTKLIVHPGMYPSLIKNWPNEMLLYRQNLGKRESFTRDVQRVMYSEKMETLEEALAGTIKLKTMIQTEITMFACTPPAQLIAAQVLEYGPVFLTGMDFCYIGDKFRFTNYVRNGNGWEAKQYPLPDDTSKFVLTETGILTEPLHLYYKKNYMSALRLTMQQCYTTDKGAITELPYYPIDKVIEKEGHGFKSIRREEMNRNLERYLASVGCYVIEYARGFGFVESVDMRTILQYMNKQNRNYVCGQCGKEAYANDGKNHVDEKCEVCKGKMKVANPIDVEKNRKRIQRLIDYVEAKK